MKQPYMPDRWVVLEFDSPNLETPVRKVLGGWYGGFAGSDNWRLNSGIVAVEPVPNRDGWLNFKGGSGSEYHCHPNNYSCSSLMMQVIKGWEDQAVNLPGYSVRILDIDEVLSLQYNNVFFGDIMAAYSREFLVDAFMSRYIQCTLIPIEKLEALEQMALRFYDEVGRDKFRAYAGLDAQAIKQYKNQC